MHGFMDCKIKRQEAVAAQITDKKFQQELLPRAAGN